MFAGVIDYTTDELSDQLIGGFHQGGERRLERVGALGLPQVVVPGCVDFTVHGPRDEVPDRFKEPPRLLPQPGVHPGPPAPRRDGADRAASWPAS